MGRTAAEVAAEINSGFKGADGRDLIQTADETVSSFILRRPFNIASMDVATGGGLPAGGTVQIAGPEGAGKNALCHQLSAQCQRIYRNEANIVWCWTEIPLDKPYAHMFGVKVPMSDKEIALENLARKRLQLKKLTKSEMAARQQSLGNFFIIGEGSTAQRLQAVVECVASNQFQLVFIDSIAALLTEARDEKDLDEEPQQSSEARLVTEFQKKIWGALGQTEGDDVNWTTLVVTNQIRANRSTAKFKKPWTVGGAHALRHGKLIDMWVKSGERIPLDRSKPKLGKMVSWEIAKGKAGCHEGPTGEVPYYFDTGFDIFKDAVITAARVGVLVQKGRYWHMVDEDDTMIEKFSGGKASIEDAINRDDDLYAEMYKQIMRRKKIRCLHML